MNLRWRNVDRQIAALAGHRPLGLITASGKPAPGRRDFWRSPDGALAVRVGRVLYPTIFATDERRAKATPSTSTR